MINFAIAFFLMCGGVAILVCGLAVAYQVYRDS